MTRNLLSRSIIVTALLVAGLGPIEAAEKIRWEDLQRRFGGTSDREGLVEHRSVDVITRDGRKHHTRRLLIDNDRVRLDGHRKMEVLPRQEIRRIEIRQIGRYFHRITDSAIIPLLGAAMVSDDDPLAALVLLPMLSPVWAYTAATAPFFLAADGVAFFIPPRTFEIVP